MKKEIQQFLEKQGFTLCIHERDFMVGESIPANIEAAINHSRRMIMVMSRFVLLTCPFENVWWHPCHDQQHPRLFV